MTLNQLNLLDGTIEFAADGTETTYDWSWSYSVPYLQEVSGQITNLDNNGYDSSEAFTLTVSAPIASTSTVKIYCGMRGNPALVSGATSWSYDSATKVLTLTIIHHSDVILKINWGIYAVLIKTMYNLIVLIYAAIIVAINLYFLKMFFSDEKFELKQIVFLMILDITSPIFVLTLSNYIATL